MGESSEIGNCRTAGEALCRRPRGGAETNPHIGLGLQEGIGGQNQLSLERGGCSTLGREAQSDMMCQLSRSAVCGLSGLASSLGNAAFPGVSRTDSSLTSRPQVVPTTPKAVFTALVTFRGTVRCCWAYSCVVGLSRFHEHRLSFCSYGLDGHLPVIVSK